MFISIVSKKNKKFFFVLTEVFIRQPRVTDILDLCIQVFY